ncbi:MAG: hypothetical protein CL808_01590 [Citromicrobium sp.]|nr:hypothetical protein [Citromicrobium sp.]
MTEDTTQAAGIAPDRQAETTGVTLYRPIIVAILYLLNLLTGFTVLIGLILAYVWRNEETTSEWEDTHLTYLIRTFWIGFWLTILVVVAVVGGAIALAAAGHMAEQVGPNAMHEGGPPPPAMIALIFGGIAIGFLLFVWYCVRCILSLANAANQRPMPNPKTWLF